MKSNEFKWIQMKSNEVEWKSNKSDEFKWNQIESPPSPQSSYPTLVGFIGIGGWGVSPAGPPVTGKSFRMLCVRTCVRAVLGLVRFQPNCRSCCFPFPFRLAGFSLFPYEHIFPFPLWAPWRNGFKWNQVNSHEIKWKSHDIKWNHVKPNELKWNQMKSIELKWHQVNSNEINWIQMKSIEIKQNEGNQMNTSDIE